MFAAYRTRKIFRHGAATYDHAKIVKDRKGMEMVNYLRARRAVSDPTPSRFISYAMKNKKIARAEFMKRWRLFR